MTPRLCSMATRLGSICSWGRSSETVSGPGSSKGSPLSVIVTGKSEVLLRAAQGQAEVADRQVGLQPHRQPPGVGRNPCRDVLANGLVPVVEHGDLEAQGSDRPERHFHWLRRADLEIRFVEQASVDDGD